MRPLAAVLLLCGFAGAARASAPDVFGLGAEESSVAGASAARVHDFSAGHYNPAGLTLTHHAEVSFGFYGFGSKLAIRTPTDERTYGMTDPMGILVGGVAPVPFIGALAEGVFLGFALHLLTDSVVRIRAHAPSEVFYPLFDNRTQRMVILPSLAVKLPAGVSLGIAFNYLAGLDGRVDAGEGATRAIEARVDEAITSVLAINAGLRWQATRGFAAALVYRQQFSVPFRTVTRNQVAGQPINLDVEAEGLFTPHELVLGFALKLPFNVTGSLDLQWSHWSAWRGPFVTVTSELPLVGAIDAQPPHVSFSDTFGVRGGLEWLAVERKYSSLSFRGGYAFQSQATPSVQPGVTNLLDGNQHRLAAGGGLRFEIFGGHIRADLHGQLDLVEPTTLHKTVAPKGQKVASTDGLNDEVADDPARPATLGTQTSNPGYPQVTGGGLTWLFGFTITVELQ